MTGSEKLELSRAQRDELDTLFADARLREPGLSDDLIARVLADAKTAQQIPEVLVASSPTPSFFAGFWQTFGPAGRAVLAASALLGISVGYLGGDTVGQLAASTLEVIDLDVIDDGIGDLSAEFVFMEG